MILPFKEICYVSLFIGLKMYKVKKIKKRRHNIFTFVKYQISNINSVQYHVLLYFTPKNKGGKPHFFF